MTQVFSRAKWIVPILVVIAMLAAVGIVWSQSGSGGTVGIAQEFADLNPAYDDQVVTPPDAGALPAVLYSITMDPPTSTVPMLGGTVATIVVTNLVPAPINNGPCGYTVDPLTGLMTPVSATRNGDIVGDLVVSADVYNNINPTGCLAVYTSAAGLNDGMPSQSQIAVKVYPNITIHPGMTVTFQVPVVAGLGAVPGAEFMLKAQLAIPGTVVVTPLTGVITAITPWTAGTLTATPPLTYGP